MRSGEVVGVLMVGLPYTDRELLDGERVLLEGLAPSRRGCSYSARRYRRPEPRGQPPLKPLSPMAKKGIETPQTTRQEMQAGPGTCPAADSSNSAGWCAIFRSNLITSAAAWRRCWPTAAARNSVHHAAD